jgi:hypothetical protein
MIRFVRMTLPVLLLSSCSSAPQATNAVASDRASAGVQAAAATADDQAGGALPDGRASQPMSAMPKDLAPSPDTRNSGFWPKTEMLPKDAVIVKGNDLQELISGSEMVSLERNGYPPTRYVFRCDGTGFFESGGDSIVQQPMKFSFANDVVLIDIFNHPFIEKFQIARNNKSYFLMFEENGSRFVSKQIIKRVSECLLII